MKTYIKRHCDQYLIHENQLTDCFNILFKLSVHFVYLSYTIFGGIYIHWNIRAGTYVYIRIVKMRT